MKEFASFACFLHMGNDLGNLLFVFFFGVLFIEDTVFFVAKSDATKTVRTVGTVIATQ
jgi:hypothetical protein